MVVCIRWQVMCADSIEHLLRDSLYSCDSAMMLRMTSVFPLSFADG